jgi:hypothetical protein
MQSKPYVAQRNTRKTRRFAVIGLICADLSRLHETELLRANAQGPFRLYGIFGTL